MYQTLIAYNGSQDGPTPASFVPQIATCVPGSLECSAQFSGNDLVYNNATTGAPQYYTFEIDSAAHFYDPSTGLGWGVYPSDVLYTFARTMGFSDLPYEEATNGWINTQDLVGAGNRSWDGGIHAPLNNTPQSILSAFMVNDSNYCPTSPVVTTNGCITFNVGASGQAWPYFLELVADNLGGSIQSCGINTFLGATVPGFTGTLASNGDGPCLLPGGGTSSTDASYTNYIATTPSTGWDTFEEQALNLPDIQPAVQWTDIGSGPYYVDNPISPSVGYIMHANPDYQAPTGCAGQPGCMPLAGAYAANADIVWEQSGDTTGLNEMAAGQADSAGFFTSDTSTVLGYSNYHLITGIPSLTIGFDPLALNFSVANEQSLDTTGQLNVPGDFFGNLAVRQFLVNAYPYQTIDSTFNTVDGIQFGEPYGGAIPHNMGDYYPSNITWPSGNPNPSATTPGNVAWWWAQATNPSSAWYDPELSSCTAGTPCKWAMFSITGATVLDAEFADWNSEIFNLTSGALAPYVFDISGQQEITALGSPPGTEPMPAYAFGWAPDYPDPTDYVAPIYYPDNSYTAPDAVSEELQATANNASTCPNNYGAWSNLTYWANIGQVPSACQGAAYDTMVAWMNAAAHESNVPYRTLEYNLIEHIGNELGLYVYDPQSVVAVDYANWIQGSTINLSPVFGGGGVQLWYDWGYAANYFTATFTEVGLPSGTDWTVTMGGTTLDSGNTSTVTFGSVTNGTYPYTIGVVAGYLATVPSGNVVISGANASVIVTYNPITGPTGTLSFTESGLKAGVAWKVILSSASGGATLSGNTTVLSQSGLPQTTYNYTIPAVTGYNTPASGQVTLTAATNVNITFLGKTYTGYAVTFTETGLASGASWTVTVNGSSHTSTTGSILVTLGNGTYSWGITSLPTGYTASPSAGAVPVAGAATGVSITATATPVGPGSSTSTSPAWTYLSTLAWVLIGVLALLVIIFLALAMMAGRRPPSSPPESWSSSSSSTTEMKDNKGGSA